MGQNYYLYVSVCKYAVTRQKLIDRLIEKVNLVVAVRGEMIDLLWFADDNRLAESVENLIDNAEWNGHEFWWKIQYGHC